MISRGKSQSRFRRVAWVSIYLSLLTGVSHVRSFPTYNLIIAVIALFTGIQDDKDVILKQTSVCAIVASLSLVADIAFCSVWAGEINESYVGVVKFTLAMFISNMFVKAAMIYSALTVSVALSLEEDSDDTHQSRELEESSSTASQTGPVESIDNEALTPASKSPGVTFSSDIEERSYLNEESCTPYKEDQSHGLSGLVSPSYNPNTYQC